MPPDPTLPSSPTRVRYALVAVATANAFLLYLDRMCMGAVVQSTSFQDELQLSPQHVGDVQMSFFFAYALGQLPAGWMADRFGPRRMLVTYIVLWSICTAATGFATGLAILLAVRLACGLAEAGAYPASARLVKDWFPLTQRARANGFVTFGGRLGGVVALWLTAWLIVQLGSWRPVLWIYGAGGLLLAAASWIGFRDTPDAHPWTNAAERALVRGETAPAPAERQPFPWKSLLTHSGLWWLSVAGLGMNLGWAFLVTWLPEYLHQVHAVDKVSASGYASAALACGAAGMLFGGWWCDALTRWFGRTWGRRLPFLIGSVVAAGAYLLCPLMPSPLAVGVLCGLVAFATDSMVPAVWSMGQDIGRRFVGATIAWSNMWGNLGAAAVAKLIPLVLMQSLFWPDWRAVFWLCAGGFLMCGAAALMVDSTRGLGEPRPTS